MKDAIQFKINFNLKYANVSYVLNSFVLSLEPSLMWEVGLCS